MSSIVPYSVPDKAYVVRHVFVASHAPSPLQTIIMAHADVPYRMRCIDAWVFLAAGLVASLQVWTRPTQTGQKLCEFDCAGVDSYLHAQVKMHSTGFVDPGQDGDSLYLWRTDAALEGELYLLFQRERIIVP
jgi:hypothetical protein